MRVWCSGNTRPSQGWAGSSILPTRTMELKKYIIRVVRGAFVKPEMLDRMESQLVEKLEGDWQSIEKVVADLEQTKELQRNMTKHYTDVKIPWYMDGRGIDSKDDMIVAFGADDGEGGKIFQFKKDDKVQLSQCVEYGVSKGIPREQMDFMEVEF